MCCTTETIQCFSYRAHPCSKFCASGWVTYPLWTTWWPRSGIHNHGYQWSPVSFLLHLWRMIQKAVSWLWVNSTECAAVTWILSYFRPFDNHPVLLSTIIGTCQTVRNHCWTLSGTNFTPQQKINTTFLNKRDSSARVRQQFQDQWVDLQMVTTQRGSQLHARETLFSHEVSKIVHNRTTSKHEIVAISHTV